MKKLFTYLLLSSFVLLNVSSAFADRKDHGRDKNCVEHRDHKNPGPNYFNDKNHSKKYDRNRDRRPNIYMRQPAPPHHQHHANLSRHYHRDFERNFWRMVSHAAYGGTNINVWQVSNDCYMVRFFLNGRYYTRPIYPYTNTYGSRSLITVNWHPANTWLNIPLININL